MSKASLALSNLRAAVIVIVVAFHAALAYIASTPSPNSAINQPPYWWQAFPIVDSHRWLGFDIFCAWQDVSLMSLMFLLSGLFTAGSLQRKGSRDYSVDRLWRVGAPFAFALLILSPLSYYAAYITRSANPSFAGFWSEWFALPFWPNGPQWFLWQLLAINLLAALLYSVYPNLIERLAKIGRWAGAHPVKFLAVLTIISAAVYAPLAFAFSPLTWKGMGPLSWQICRPLHYVVYFFAGCAFGAYGLDRGLLSLTGSLACRPWFWFAAALAAFGLWAGCTSLTFPNWYEASSLARLAASLGFPLACATGSICLLALFLRYGSPLRWRRIDSLSANAYSIYLLHYVFVVWTQFALLGSNLPAPVKMLLVLSVALSASWTASLVFTRLTAAMPTVTFGQRGFASVPR